MHSDKSAIQLANGPNDNIIGLKIGANFWNKFLSTVGSVIKNGAVPLKWLSLGVFVYIWCCKTWSNYQPFELKQLTSNVNYP